MRSSPYASAGANAGLRREVGAEPLLAPPSVRLARLNLRNIDNLLAPGVRKPGNTGAVACTAREKVGGVAEFPPLDPSTRARHVPVVSHAPPIAPRFQGAASSIVEGGTGAPSFHPVEITFAVSESKAMRWPRRLWSARRPRPPPPP